MVSLNFLALSSCSSLRKLRLYRIDPACAQRLIGDTASTAVGPDGIARVTRLLDQFEGLAVIRARRTWALLA